MKTLYKMNNVCKRISSLGKALTLTVAMLSLGMGASAYNLHTVPAGDYYFDNTRTGWDKVYIRLGSANDDSKWISVFPMAKMGDNANMWQVTFGGNVTNVTHIQFANTDGYTEGNHIFDGNNIPAGNKTKYIELTDGDWSTTYPLTVAFAEMDDGSSRNIAPGQPMPGGFSDKSITLGGKSIISGTFGYFNPSASVTLAGTATATYGTGISPTNDCVTITMNYNKDGATVNEKLALMGANKSTKTASKSVTLPSTVGKHTFTYFLKAGGYAGTTTTAYYHIVGLTGQSLEFGAIDKGSQKMLTEKLSNVWGGDNVNKVTATITGTGASAFSFSADDASVKSKDINVSNKAGSADIYFNAPSEDATCNATLTLEMTCGDNSKITKTYTLKGVTKTEAPTVMLGAEPVYLNGPKATLSGYLKYYACNNNIKEAGIVWGTSANPTVGGSGVKQIKCSEGTSLTTGATWSGTTATTFTPGNTYHYRAYVRNTAIENGYYYSPDGTFTYSSACVYPIEGDTVYVTVDNALAADDACALKFRSIDAAVSSIKDNAMFCSGKGSTNKLLYNIVLQVAPNKQQYTGTDNHILLDGINNYALDGSSKVLIIRSSESSSRPTLMKVRLNCCKNIILDNIRMMATGSTESALNIQTNHSDWANIKVGDVADSRVVIKNCYIESHGFTGMEMWGYDNVMFENNDIECFVPESSTAADLKNLVCWGSSMKVSQCSNIKFLRNNFRGSHTTSLWLQGLRGGLFMNNVFWNSNDSYYADFKNNTCFIRLVTQFATGGDKSNINEKLGFYYNTLYLADNSTVSTDRYVDFFRLASGYMLENEKGEKTGINVNLGQNYASSIRFQYNNCYAYDRSSVKGSNNQGGTYAWNLGDSQNWCASINHNNFWSWIDNIGTATESVFNIPTSCTGTNKNYFVNVYEQVCKATNDPSDLVVKGGDMNFGKHITASTDASELGAEEYYNDRLYASNGADAIRKTDGKWTLGAYQQTDGNDFPPVKVLIWTGAADSDWDNRGNWITPKADGTGYKKLTCVENIDMDVQIIIPAPDNTEYTGDSIKRYPAFPNKFEGTRTDKSNETVNAGHGIGTPTKFASSINLEYGAAIKNVEALKDDDARRYTEANTSFTAGRSEWILVGTVVKPFTDGSKSSVRLVQSGDYFIADHLPHVYMHEAELKGESADWQRAFADLDVSVPYDRVFAIKIPNEYGPKKTTAKMYYTLRDKSKINDGVVPKTFNFNGWFLNDEVIPEYKITGDIIMSNTYPAALSIASLKEENHGNVKYYDYDAQEFINYVSGNKYIKPQGGFIFKPVSGNDGWFRITKEMLTDQDTKYKSSTAVNPYMILRASNPSGTDGSSSVAIIYDELKSDEYVEGNDLINTTIAGMPTKPEVYAMMYSKELDKLTVPSLESAIPLGLKLEKAMTVDFTISEIDGIETAVLEDVVAGKSYDLLKGEKGSIELAAGTYAGRFFLNLGAEEQGMPTEDDPIEEQGSAISIYAGEDGVIVISSSLDENLVEAQITNMGGNTQTIKLKDSHYNEIKLDGVQGTYIVTAIGETQSKTAKVIVK
ncbi:MAG: hypothetical protein MJ007_00935 [Paludibacteraceae bacterium]|nr:hypothetical protein [Paludibacteraceae bacterium]